MVKISNLNSFYIESYNGCGFSEHTKQTILSSKNNPDILCFPEMHLKPEDVSVNGPWLLSGGDLNDKAAGVGMLLSERAQKALFFVNPITPRILLTRFHGEFSDFTVIVTYIPPQSRLVDQKKVYDDLHVVASRISKHDCKVIVGDLNSRLARQINLIIMQIVNMLEDGQFIREIVMEEFYYVN